jgi:hypothetical protein
VSWATPSKEEDIYYETSLYINKIFKSRRMRWAWHVARMGEKRKVYRILMRNPEGKRPLGIPRRRRDFGKIGWDGMDWTDLAQDRDQWRSLVITVMNIQVP